MRPAGPAVRLIDRPRADRHLALLNPQQMDTTVTDTKIHDGMAAQAYGFTVTANGLGANSFNVGGNGDAFGVANYTTLNVYQLLLAVNAKANNGVLYGGDPTLRTEAIMVIDALNQAGDIG